MATTRASGYVVTAAVWNAVLNKLTDDGNTYSGAFNGSSVAGTTGSFSSTLAVTGASTLTGAVSMGSTLALTAAGGTIKERGRTTAMGEWIAVSFSAGNFDAISTAEWTVDSGDVDSNRYMLVGKTLWWNLRVGSTTVVSGDEGLDYLIATIPGGFTANATSAVAAAYLNDNGTVRSGLVEAISGTTEVRISRNDGVDLAASTNGTYVYFLIAIEVA